MSFQTATRCAVAMAAGAIMLLLAPGESHAQFGGLTKKAKARADQATNQAVDKGLDQVDPTKQGSTSATPAPAPTPAQEGAAAPVAATAAPAANASPGATPAAAPVATEWANYDFVPGNRVIFDLDYSDDKVGNFPERLEYKSGQLELVELDGVRMLKASDRAELYIPLSEPLPPRYTIEIDFISKNGTWGAISVAGGREKSSDASTRVDVGDQGIEIMNGYTKVVNSYYSDAQKKALQGSLVHARFQGDNKYLKVYTNERRVANIPNAMMVRGNSIYLSLWGTDGGDRPVYVGRIRVAETQATVYDALSSDGRWTTQGILFETGKSEPLPESTPTLKEIAATLKAHPDLTVEVQGHTDNVGKPADNLALSDARAAAVKSALVQQYGANPAQLTTKGYGDTKPVGDNKSAEGRQNNRRVDLVKS